MKAIISVARNLVIIFSICLCAGVLSATEDKYIKVAATEWEPFTGEKLLNMGFLSEMALEVLKKAGYKTKIFILPWARAVNYTKTGKTQALLGAGFTEERKQWFIYPNPLFANEWVLFTQKDRNIKFTSFEDLAPATIGIIQGSRWIKIFNNIKGFEISAVPHMEQNLRMVANNRIDYSLESRATVDFILNNRLTELKNKIKIVLPPIETTNIYIVFSKEMSDYEAVTLNFNKALNNMRKDGGLKRILDKHGISY